MTGLIYAQVCSETFKDSLDSEAVHDDPVNGVVERQDGEHVLAGEVAGGDVGPKVQIFSKIFR